MGVVQSKSPEGSPFADGPLIAKAADLGNFSGCRENSELLRKLNKRLKFFAERMGGLLQDDLVKSGNTERAS